MDSLPLQFDLLESLAAFDLDELEKIRQAGEQVQENLHLLKKSNENMVGQCLANQGTFYEEDHFPKGDVYDRESHAQYYYHAHRPDSGEHGHFHTFLRSAGMKRKWRPLPYKGDGTRPTGKDALSHIVAVSMNGPGLPVGLFSTNRWVTAESFYSAEDVVEMIDYFSIDQSYPCLATNRALSGILKFFKPQVYALLVQRDKTINAWSELHPDRDVYEDRELEITSIVDINIEKQMSAVKKTIRNKQRDALRDGHAA